MAVLIPTSSPAVLTNAPPELPGLTAASVCKKLYCAMVVASNERAPERLSTAKLPVPLIFFFPSEKFLELNLQGKRVNDIFI